MKTILVLSNHPDFAEEIRVGLNPGQYRVVHRLSADEAEPLLAHGLVAVCILDADLMDVELVWMVDRLRRFDLRAPIVVYTSANASAWEEEAFLHGVTHVLTKPVRARLLNTVLERLVNAAVQRTVPVAPAPPQGSFSRAAEPAPYRPSPPSPTLDVLRDFSSILTYSLNSEAMLRQFLAFLREILSVNRAAIFLNRPCAPLSETISPEDSQRLHVASAIGLSPGLLEHFELSLETGIGGQIVRLGRILRRDSDETRANPEAQKEFEVLGAQVAVPIADRNGIVGVAVFDGRLTGEPLINGELELIFHLLEQVALALRNIWLHNQIAGNNEMMTDVLRELSSACIVIGSDLKVLHANRSALRHFGQKNKRTPELEFSDLPHALGAKIYQVLKTGAAMGPFRYEPENSPGTVYKINVVPFHAGNSAVPASALLTAEDLTQTEQLQKLEVEAEHLRLINAMSNRLVNEIGNAVLPLSTHDQLLAESPDIINDPEIQKSLKDQLNESVKRIIRLKDQMRFLARDSRIELKTFPLGKLIEEAYQEARKHQTAEAAKAAKLQYQKVDQPINVTADRAALKHALSEIMLNALQANPKAPTVDVHLHTGPGKGGGQDLQIEVQDNGPGFTAEAAKKATSAFYSTRVGAGLVGLGLTVSQKIIDTHHGKLEIVPPQPGHAGVVRVSLPLEPAVSTAA
ncbi:MAG TPA: ATP-binding protein [Verrucomicrobiae bacterium]|nr:ATP-binding protein [Verrucomicrobiae bacterium]